MTDTTTIIEPVQTRESPENPKTSLANPADWLQRDLGVMLAASGASVSEQTSLRVTAVWRCVWLIASTIASLPLNVYERQGDNGRVVAGEHPAHELLHDEPNPDMPAIVLREILIAFALLYGNGYAGIERNGAGVPVALWPIHPSDVKVGRINGVKYYQVTAPGQPSDYWADQDILHIPGMGFDGLSGMRAMDVLKQSVGLALSAEEYGGRYFGNSAPPGVVIEAPNTVSDTALKNLKDSWNRTHGGIANAHKTAILEEGMKVSRFMMTNNDAQFLDTRKFQLTEIARFFGVPPHLVGDLERATFSNIEQQALDFEKYGLRRWLVIFEQEAKRKLIRRDDRRKYYVEHNVAGLLRGDIESRYRAHATGIQWGFANRDTVCDLENLPRLPDGQGQVYLVPSNMMAASALPTEPATKPDPNAEQNARQLRGQMVAALQQLATRDFEFRQVAQRGVAAVGQWEAEAEEAARVLFAPIRDDAADLARRYVTERSRTRWAQIDANQLITVLETR